MKLKMPSLSFSFLFILIIAFSCQSQAELEWPEITSENKPWTRWWWQGSAVNEVDLTKALEEYAKAGLGGVEITPIYGVKGEEDKYIEYLSPEWTDMLLHTLDEADGLDLGVDMATGTGWPFGGPWIAAEEACLYMAHKVYNLSGGKSLNEPIKFIQSPINRTIGKRVNLTEIARPISGNDSLQQIAFEQIRFEEELPLVVLMAYEDGGAVIELTNKVDEEGMLNWTAPKGNWKLYAVFRGLHGKIVERAAPGGEGDVIDHFSKDALDQYFSKFDEALDGQDISLLRGFFNDSYEVDDAQGEADFTPELFNEFKKRRGYDLRENLPALFGHDISNNKHIRVLNDYRLTISELLRENFTVPWNEWADAKGALVRNQAHGSPANILDLYASVDIPETEGEDLLRIKFASSAGNVTGKRLIACEAATWLDEHFQSSLAEAKTNIDRYFLGGVNHIVYHGTPYSPADAEWPGWMFYASVHFAPTNSFWNDFPALNHYVARCQSLLQAGEPDNDILLYFPFHDRISTPGRSLLQHFSGGGPGNDQTKFRAIAEDLIQKGYSLDYVSDAQILGLNFDGTNLLSEGGAYQTILVPACSFIPLETFEKLAELSENGAVILFQEHLPDDISGYANYGEKKKSYDELVNNLLFEEVKWSGIEKANLGKGTFVRDTNLVSLLDAAGVLPESMVYSGLQYIRRKNANGRTYFIKNSGTEKFDGYIRHGAMEKSVAIFNPNTDRTGLAEVRSLELGPREVYLQLEPGESCFLRTFDDEITGEKYPFYEANDASISLETNWELSFISGGPTLPDTRQLSKLIPWTDLDGEEFSSFSGTAKYTCSFELSDEDQESLLLDLGEVAASAQVYINDKKIATLYSPPFQTMITSDMLRSGVNKLEIHVSNLMANRILYMEKNGIEYRNFYNVNFPASKAKNRGANGLFTALNWEPLPSGLEGPVTLTALKLIEF